GVPGQLESNRARNRVVDGEGDAGPVVRAALRGDGDNRRLAVCVDGSSRQCDRARHCERAEQASYLHVTSFVSAFRANRRATLICTRIEVGSLHAAWRDQHDLRCRIEPWGLESTATENPKSTRFYRNWESGRDSRKPVRLGLLTDTRSQETCAAGAG